MTTTAVFDPHEFMSDQNQAYFDSLPPVLTTFHSHPSADWPMMIAVDCENAGVDGDPDDSSDGFWTRLEAVKAGAPNALQDWLRISDQPGYVTREDAAVILAFVAQIEGWDADDAPEYAPHPMLIQEA